MPGFLLKPQAAASPRSPRSAEAPSTPTRRGGRARTAAARARSPAPPAHGAPDSSAPLMAPPAFRSLYKGAAMWASAAEAEQGPRDSSSAPTAARKAAAARPRRGGRTAAAAAGAVMSPSFAASQWDDESRVLALVARHLRVSEAEAARRLRQLEVLLPGLPAQLGSMDPSVVARLAGDVGAVTRRLLQLRLIFPEADAFKMALREPFLLLGASRPRLERAAKSLRRLLPGLNVDRLVEDAPALLDVKALKGAIKDFQRAEPTLELSQVLQMDPSTVFRFSFRHHPNISSALGRRTAAAASAVAPAESG